MSGLQKQNQATQQQQKQNENGKKFVNDLISSNSKQLLNAYVYDFLIKSSLPQTASTFIKEADVPTDNNQNKNIKTPPQKELLPLAISMDAPQGFLYEWWQIFWDVFNARTHRGGSENAQHYYHLQLVRQRKEHALHSSTFHAAHAQAQSLSGMQHQQQLLLQQQQHQNQLMAQQRGGVHPPVGTPNGQVPNLGQFAPGQTQQQQQHAQAQQSFAPNFNQFGQNGNFVSPHHQPLQPSQTQQEVQQHFQQQQSQLLAGQKRGNIPAGPGNLPQNYARLQQQQAQAQFQINQMRQQQQQQQQQQHAGAGFPQFQQFKAPPMPGGQPYMGQQPPQPPHPQQQPPTPVVPVNNTNGSTPRNGGTSPNKKLKVDDSSNHPSPLSGSSSNMNNPSPMTNVKSNNTNSNNSHPSPLINQTDKDTSTNSSASALQDYQMQLMLLERENKRMLDGSKKDTKKNKNSPHVNSKNMPPPKALKNSTTPASSPAVGNKAIPEGSTTPTTNTTTTTTATTTTNGRKKKEPAQRKKSKKANAPSQLNNTNTSEPPTPTTPLTPNPVTSANTTKNKESSNLKDEKASSQLTPPNSENATTANNNQEDQKPQTSTSQQEPQFSNTPAQDKEDSSKPSDELLGGGGSAMISGHHSASISNELYNDFPLSDFSNDLPGGDEGFNLESFLNTDGGDLGNFDSYWRDSVEATD